MSEYVRTGTSFGLGGIFHFKALCLGLASCFVFASMGTKRKTSQDSKPCFEKHISRVYLPIWNETWARPALRTLSRRSSKTFLAASLASAKRSKHVKAPKSLGPLDSLGDPFGDLSWRASISSSTSIGSSASKHSQRHKATWPKDVKGQHNNTVTTQAT